MKNLDCFWKLSIFFYKFRFCFLNKTDFPEKNQVLWMFLIKNKDFKKKFGSRGRKKLGNQIGSWADDGLLKRPKINKKELRIRSPEARLAPELQEFRSQIGSWAKESNRAKLRSDSVSWLKAHLYFNQKVSICLFFS